MKLTIFGASGGIGRFILEQATAAGHDVTAVVRNPKSLPQGVRVVTADLLNPDPAVLAAAVAGADAVLSGLGQRNAKDAGITSRGTRAIIQAMQATNVRRIVAVSASPVETVPSPGRPNPPKRAAGDGLLIAYVLTPIVKRAFGPLYADLAIMEDILRESGEDWTVVRPTRLTNKPLTGVYRTATERNIRGGRSISRADVAHLMLAVLNQPETIRKAVRVAY